MPSDQVSVFNADSFFAPLTPLLKRADLVWFDADDTLFRSEEVNLDQIRDVISAHAEKKFNRAAMEMCCRHLKGSKIPDIVRTVGDAYGVKFSEDDIEKIAAEIKRQRLETFTQVRVMDRVPLFPELAEYVKKSGAPLCIVTASEAIRVPHFLAISGQGNTFEGEPRKWLFASNLAAKTEQHRIAHLTLSTSNGVNIDARRAIGFEDSPSAIKQGIAAGVVVVPHTLCERTPQGPQSALVRKLQQIKFDALRGNGITEYVIDTNGKRKPIETPSDVPVITNARNFVPVFAAALETMPDRPAGLKAWHERRVEVVVA